MPRHKVKFWSVSAITGVRGLKSPEAASATLALYRHTAAAIGCGVQSLCGVLLSGDRDRSVGGFVYYTMVVSPWMDLHVATPDGALFTGSLLITSRVRIPKADWARGETDAPSDLVAAYARINGHFLVTHLEIHALPSRTRERLEVLGKVL